MMNSRLCKAIFLIAVFSVSYFGASHNSYAVTTYYRFEKARQPNPHTPGRFNYLTGDNRHPTRNTLCRTHGNSRCLSQAAADTNPSRYRNRLRKKAVHPYLRNLKQYRAVKVEQNF